MTDVPTNPDAIDRLTPARCPNGRPVMYHKWRSLLFLHWALPPEAIRPLLPAGLDLDLFEGNAYVGLVPFTMRGVRPAGLPSVPWLSNFHETNVRTYVHVGGRDPGVWFFSLDAANPVAVALARSLLPYHHARMSITDQNRSGGPGRLLSYRSERLWPGPVPARSAVDVHIPPSTPVTMPPGTLDHFLIERYLLYTKRLGRLVRVQVHHEPYPIQSAETVAIEESLVAASGMTRPDLPPLVHFSAGVDVKIFRPFFLVKS